MAVGALDGSFALVQVGALLLALVAVLAVLGRRLRSTGAPQSVRLTPQHAVHLVELGGRAFVVGTGPGAAPAMLVELPRPPSEEKDAPGGEHAAAETRRGG